MKHIIVKEIDKLKSTMYKNKFTSEYLIYLIEDNDTISAEIAIGKDGKDQVITKYLSKVWLDHTIRNRNIDIKFNACDYIRNITFEDYKKQN